MKVLSSTSLLDGDEILKVVKVRKCDVDYHKLKSHPSYNEFCAIYGYYLYKIQSDNETRTFPGFVRSLKAIQERNSGYNMLRYDGTANNFLYFVEVINKYATYIAENKFAAKYRMSCASFFGLFNTYKRDKDSLAINEKLFTETPYSDFELIKRTHFYRLVEFYHVDISENLPEGISLYHPMPSEEGFKISHGIVPLYIVDKEKLRNEEQTYYGRLYN